MNRLTAAIPLKKNELRNALTYYQDEGELQDHIDKYALLKSMITHIGSTDSVLRDQLIYNSFCRLSLDNQIEHELFIEFAETCVSEAFLFHNIGEYGTDTVFTRSFTTLLLALILYKDNEEDFLPQSMIDTIKEKMILYIKSEKDLRGYVPGKGWAHSIAHAADVFDELAKSKKINQGSAIELLKALWNKIYIYESVYVHDEDERIIIAIMEFLHHGVSPEEVASLVRGMPSKLKEQKEHVEEENYWFLYANCKTFLKSLHYSTNKRDDLNFLQKEIERCLASLT